METEAEASPEDETVDPRLKKEAELGGIQILKPQGRSPSLWISWLLPAEETRVPTHLLEPPKDWYQSVEVSAPSPTGCPWSI